MPVEHEFLDSVGLPDFVQLIFVSNCLYGDEALFHDAERMHIAITHQKLLNKSMIFTALWYIRIYILLDICYTNQFMYTAHTL